VVGEAVPERPSAPENRSLGPLRYGEVNSGSSVLHSIIDMKAFLVRDAHEGRRFPNILHICVVVEELQLLSAHRYVT